MNDLIRDEATRSYWVISIIALVWNLIGVMTYLMHVMSKADDVALYTAEPAWVTGAYAIAVFGGTLGCINLLFRQSWAVPVFAVSLVAILLQMGYSVLFTDIVEQAGPSALIMPAVIIAIGAYLLYFAKNAKSRGILA